MGNTPTSQSARSNSRNRRNSSRHEPPQEHRRMRSFTPNKNLQRSQKLSHNHPQPAYAPTLNNISTTYPSGNDTPFKMVTSKYSRSLTPKGVDRQLQIQSSYRPPQQSNKFEPSTSMQVHNTKSSYPVDQLRTQQTGRFAQNIPQEQQSDYYGRPNLQSITPNRRPTTPIKNEQTAIPQPKGPFINPPREQTFYKNTILNNPTNTLSHIEAHTGRQQNFTDYSNPSFRQTDKSMMQYDQSLDNSKGFSQKKQSNLAIYPTQKASNPYDVLPKWNHERNDEGRGGKEEEEVVSFQEQMQVFSRKSLPPKKAIKPTVRPMDNYLSANASMQAAMRFAVEYRLNTPLYTAPSASLLQLSLTSIDQSPMQEPKKSSPQISNNLPQYLRFLNELESEAIAKIDFTSINPSHKHSKKSNHSQKSALSTDVHRKKEAKSSGLINRHLNQPRCTDTSHHYHDSDDDTYLDMTDTDIQGERESPDFTSRKEDQTKVGKNETKNTARQAQKNSNNHSDFHMESTMAGQAVTAGKRQRRNNTGRERDNYYAEEYEEDQQGIRIETESFSSKQSIDNDRMREVQHGQIARAFGGGISQKRIGLKDGRVLRDSTPVDTETETMRAEAHARAEKEYSEEVRKAEIEEMLLGGGSTSINVSTNARNFFQKRSNFQSHTEKQARINELVEKHLAEMRREQTIRQRAQLYNEASFKHSSEEASKQYQESHILLHHNDKHSHKSDKDRHFKNHHKHSNSRLTSKEPEDDRHHNRYNKQQQQRPATKEESGDRQSLYQSEFYKDHEQEIVNLIMSKNVFRPTEAKIASKEEDQGSSNRYVKTNNLKGQNILLSQQQTFSSSRNPFEESAILGLDAFSDFEGIQRLGNRAAGLPLNQYRGEQNKKLIETDAEYQERDGSNNHVYPKQKVTKHEQSNGKLIQADAFSGILSSSVSSESELQLLEDIKKHVVNLSSRIKIDQKDLDQSSTSLQQKFASRQIAISKEQVSDSFISDTSNILLASELKPNNYDNIAIRSNPVNSYNNSSRSSDYQLAALPIQPSPLLLKAPNNNNSEQHMKEVNKPTDKLAKKTFQQEEKRGMPVNEAKKSTINNKREFQISSGSQLSTPRHVAAAAPSTTFEKTSLGFSYMPSNLPMFNPAMSEYENSIHSGHEQGSISKTLFVTRVEEQPKKKEQPQQQQQNNSTGSGRSIADQLKQRKEMFFAKQRSGAQLSDGESQEEFSQQKQIQQMGGKNSGFSSTKSIEGQSLSGVSNYLSTMAAGKNEKKIDQDMQHQFSQQSIAHSMSSLGRQLNGDEKDFNSQSSNKEFFFQAGDFHQQQPDYSNYRQPDPFSLRKTVSDDDDDEEYKVVGGRQDNGAPATFDFGAFGEEDGHSSEGRQSYNDGFDNQHQHEPAKIHIDMKRYKGF